MRLSTLGSALVGLAVAQASTINYTAVTGYFLQDEDSTDASTFDYVSEVQIPGKQECLCIKKSFYIDVLNWSVSWVH